MLSATLDRVPDQTDSHTRREVGDNSGIALKPESVEVPMPQVTQESTPRRRRGRAASGSQATTRTRRSQAPSRSLERMVADLDRTISALIKENRDLQRQIERLSRHAIGGISGAAERALRSMQRRIGTAGGSRRGSAVAASPSRIPRKVTDPELLERRRQALAKARAARAAKRAAAP
jgi:hypothetical protein